MLQFWLTYISLSDSALDKIVYNAIDYLSPLEGQKQKKGWTNGGSSFANQIISQIWCMQNLLKSLLVSFRIEDNLSIIFCRMDKSLRRNPPEVRVTNGQNPSTSLL